VVAQAQRQDLLSAEHFTVDGTLIRGVGAKLKSFRRKDAPVPPDDPGNPTVDFHGERRSTDPTRPRPPRPIVARATKRRWSPTQLLEHLAEFEQQERARRSLERRLLRSRVGRFTPMSDFDWNWPKRVERATIEAILRLDFLAEARNIVLVAAPGLGKTMIAQNIAHTAVLAGHHVLFTTAAQLLLDLGSQESAHDQRPGANPGVAGAAHESL
jgi:IstB-like ATP binding protein